MGLSRKPREARAFYGALAFATALGVLIVFAPIDPIRALFWAAVVNGVAAVPLMVVIMLLASRRDVMGDFAIRGLLWAGGWLVTAVMTLAVGAMFLLMLL
jgi:Mn2+/Fe2+ NRAMP family transporter